jgi:hypothetical protein
MEEPAAPTEWPNQGELIMRRIVRIGVITLALALAPALGALADEMGGTGFEVPQQVTAPPPPYVELASHQVAAGVGFSWGAGTLSFEGQQYGFSVKGLSIADLGVSKMVAEGEVEGLERVSDFAGRYLAVKAGVAAGQGASRLVLRNEHGVVIRLASDLSGVALTLGAEGFQIALQ